MSCSDIGIGYWRYYLVVYGGLRFASVILIILGALRANIYISSNIEYILLGVGVLLSGIDYLLIRGYKKLQYLVSLLVGAFLNVGISYFILSLIVLYFGVGFSIGWLEIVIAVLYLSIEIILSCILD